MGAHPKEQDRVVVTGFGPFGIHKVNASWVAVQELKNLGLEDPFVDLVTEEIQVDYDFVKVSGLKPSRVSISLSVCSHFSSNVLLKLFNIVVDWILAQFDIYMEIFVYFPTQLIPH